MIKLKVYNQQGESINSLELAEDIISDKQNKLSHQYWQGFLNNQRQSNSKVKDRSEVAGSGKKPWRQKGTGRARAGSLRSPIWRGGGITFGPTNKRNYKVKYSKKITKKAFKMAFASKIKNIIILDKLIVNNISTKNAENILQKLPIDKGQILLILDQRNPKAELSFSNLPYLKIRLVDGVTIDDIMTSNWLIFTVDSIKKFQGIKK